MKLNAWHKAGIALSLLWAIGAGIQTRNYDVKRADDFASYAYKVCSDGLAIKHDPDRSSCDKEKADNLDVWMKNSGKDVAFAALAPIPFAWLAAFILIFAWRVQVAGIRAVAPWSGLSRPKKAFAAFCWLSLFATAGFGCVVMNLYVDTEVPVALVPTAMVIKTGDLVAAKGTWINTDSNSDNALAFPLQTSDIECDRSVPRCVEARASVSGNLMSAEVVDYDIDSWTDKSIVLRRDGPCAEEVYTIDLATDVVSGSGHRTNGDKPFCAMSKGTEKWSYRLADGFPVYWDLRTKARPWPLRVVQSFFGH